MGCDQCACPAAVPACCADMSWLLFELMWRDFFRFITDKYAGVAQPAPAHGRQQPAMQTAFAMA